MSAKPEAVAAAIKKLRDRAGWWQGDKNAEAVLTELVELHTQPLVDAGDHLSKQLVERGIEANNLQALLNTRTEALKEIRGMKPRQSGDRFFPEPMLDPDDVFEVCDRALI